MSRDTYASHPLRQSAPDLSTMSVDEIHALRDAIMKRARETMDPDGLGLNVLMQSTDDSSWFSTDEVSYRDWMDWVQNTIRVVSDSATRLGAGVIAAGGAIAASNMYASDAGGQYAGMTLAVSGVFAAWFVGSAVAGAMRGR